ncbi:MAG: cytochrome ubiquinol oxidase subunit I [Solirubrobacteraceae bacterium]|jgi:cytochrome bd ubiquinol oxidase subunit I|nr:cytochrome ubiquinol oxidase subunit I [Solirubrobacteraceae bacterium]MDP4673612.1 cytochrome ubiquinol oxidase subunit I [Solirubrobacteraceae bacterium]MDP4920717.1 cytochrome ubiquinol oxidase subunit I [Solirubrobacteraceae bacterium]
MDSLPLAADALTLARWQFATTTLYHFIFVPLTLGLAPVIAYMQTKWYRTRDESWLRLTKFFGTLLLINFAIGAATGLLQEFQFGMNWSSYSQFVGDVFGSTLALEGLIAFMLESTFIGIWVFGWGRLSERMHLASIWLVVAGTWLSTTFILMANSWMQNPVGYSIDTATGQARMVDLWAVLTNPIAIWAVAHTLLASLMVAAFLLLGVACWHILKGRNVELFRPVVKLSLYIAIPITTLTLLVGSEFGVALTGPQPMKIAAAEALWETEQPASFSLFQIGGFSAEDPVPSFSLDIPYLLSFLATNTFTGKVEGMNQVQDAARTKYGPGNYIPDVKLAYWSMRGMAYLGSLSMMIALLGGFLYWRGTLEKSRWFLKIAVGAISLPFITALIGWIFTETARQPWVAYGVLKTADGLSQSVGSGEIIASLTAFMLLYIAIGITAFVLLRRYAILDPPQVLPVDDAKSEREPVPSY